MNIKITKKKIQEIKRICKQHNLHTNKLYKSLKYYMDSDLVMTDDFKAVEQLSLEIDKARQFTDGLNLGLNALGIYEKEGKLYLNNDEEIK